MVGSRVTICAFVVVIINSITKVDAVETKETISSVFESLGFSPFCIAEALAVCEHKSAANKYSDDAYLQMHEKSEQHRPRNCGEVHAMGDHTSGVREIFPYDCCKHKKLMVYCDQDTDGGGWTVFQNRDNLTMREDFYRTWIEYTLGFGNVSGEYWLGLDNIHALVSTKLVELRVDLEDYDGIKRWAKYGFFYVGDSTSKYALNIGRYSGDAGDSLNIKSGTQFSTHDQDNDSWPDNCSIKFRGAWWYQACHESNLNGYQHVGKHVSHADGVNWYKFREHYYSLRKSSMKIRPAFKS